MTRSGCSSASRAGRFSQSAMATEVTGAIWRFLMSFPIWSGWRSSPSAPVAGLLRTALTVAQPARMPLKAITAKSLSLAQMGILTSD